MPKRRSSRSAVSGVTPRFPCTSSLTRGYETPSRSAKPVWLRPSGLRLKTTYVHPHEEYRPPAVLAFVSRAVQPLLLPLASLSWSNVFPFDGHHGALPAAGGLLQSTWSVYAIESAK